MLQPLLDKYKLLLISVIIVFVMGCAFLYHVNQSGEEAPVEEALPQAVPALEEEAAASEERDIFVDVKGAVKNPGIYKAVQSERVNDLIIRAGGFTEEAHEESVNLAQKVVDEMVIYVPKEGEDGAGQPEVLTGQGDSEVLNINQAEEQDFDGLPGIGPAKAKAIIEYRSENGPFKTVDELKDVTGIGEATFERLKENITVN